MLDEIRKKLIDVESKLFTTAISATQAIGGRTIPAVVPSRHYPPIKSDLNSFYIRLNTELQDTLQLSNMYESLLIFFYNTKETQMQTFKERLEVLSLRRRILSAFTYGLQKSIISLNDKKIFMGSLAFGQDESGIWFPHKEQNKIVPVKVEITNNSNIRIGTINDQLVNSKAEALWTDDQNDIFSVYRTDSESLTVDFILSFKRAEIINEIEFEYVAKTGQEVTVTVVNIESQETLYSGTVQDFWIGFSSPVRTKELLIKVGSTGIVFNQLDIKKIGIYSRLYSQTLVANTIKLASLSNKLLTFENYNLIDDRQKEFLDVRVEANGELLSPLNSGERPKGPFIDPTLKITVVLKNKEKALDYLQISKYKVAKYLPSNITDFKVIRNIGDENAIATTSMVSLASDIFIDFPIPNLEDLFTVYLNGKQKFRKIEDGSLTGNQYKIEYTGTGYLLKFSSVPVYSELKCILKTMPAILSGKKIQFPLNGLGRDIKYEYSKELKIKRFSPFFNASNMYVFDVKNIQEVIFKDNSNQELPFIEKEIGSTLTQYDFTIDKENGILKVSSTANALTGQQISYIDVHYLETSISGGLTDTTNREVAMPSDIGTFTAEGAVDDYTTGNIKMYGLPYGSDNTFIVNSNNRGFQLPRYFALHKGSVTVDNKREVGFIDGISEIDKNLTSSLFYDYTEEYSGIYTFQLRTGQIEIANLVGKEIVINSEYFKVKKDSVDLLQSSGDYAYDGEYIYLKIQNKIIPSINVFAKEADGVDVFSVDYLSNRIYTKDLSTTTRIKFSYSTIRLIDFAIDIEIPLSASLKEKDYFLYVSNPEDKITLLPYFTPVLESLEIGVFE
jgi:hypothetical protein